jgi:hypothetical protein
MTPLIAKMRQQNVSVDELRRKAAIMRRLNHLDAAAELEAEARRVACSVCGGVGHLDGHLCTCSTQQPTVWLAQFAHEVLNLCRQHGAVRVQPLGGEAIQISPSEPEGYFLVRILEPGFEFAHIHSANLLAVLLDEPTPYTVRKV